MTRHSSESSSDSGDMDKAICGFEGNPDIYGLGIRLGIYLQWISSCLLFHGHFNRQWSTSLVDVSAIFETAILVASIVLVTDTGSAVYSVEVVVTTLIFFGDFYFVQVAAVVSHRKNIDIFSIAGILIRLLLCVAMLSFAVWLWFPGFDQLQQTPCGSYVFIFAKASTSAGGVRKFLQALACIHMLIWAIPLCFSLFVLWPVFLFASSTFLLEAKVAGRDGTDGRLAWFEQVVLSCQAPLMEFQGDEDTGWNSIKVKGLRRLALIVLLVFSVLMILAIELTLVFNSISGVYDIKSTGQLIPFVIGLGGLWTTVNDMLAGYYKEKYWVTRKTDDKNGHHLRSGDERLREEERMQTH